MEINFNRKNRLAELLSTLDNPKATRDARVDIYLILFRDISKGTPDVLEDLFQSAATLERHIKADINLADSGLVQSALNVLGYMLHLPKIANSFSAVTLRAILQDLCLLLETSDDKGICAKALWCLGQQAIPEDIISKELTRVLAVLNTCIVGKSFESSAVEFEAINVYQRLLKQCPGRLLTNDDDWFKMVYPFVISKNIKVAERALKFLEKNLELFKGRNEKFSMCLINDLQQGLTDRLKIMFTKQREIFVLRVWSCYITILGKNMHQGTPLTNNLFKVVELAFKSTSCEVLVAAFDAWMTLVDNFAMSKSAILSKKRLKLLMMPLVNSSSKSERNIKVEQARLNCWLHLIKSLKDELNEIFDQVVSPLLHFLFSLPNTSGSNMDLSLSKTPTKVPGVDDIQVHTPKTPAASEFDRAVQNSPKGSNLHFDSPILKKIGAQIIYHLLKDDDSEIEPLDADIKFTPERLSVENFKNNSVLFLSALQDLTLKCGKQIDEKLLLAIWQRMLHYTNEIAALGEKQYLTLTIGGVLLALQTVTNTECTSNQVAMRIVSLCYEKLRDVIIQNKDLVKTIKNPQGSFPLHIIQLLFYESKFVDDVVGAKLYSLYAFLLRDVVSGISGQFDVFSQIIDSIKVFSKHSIDQDATRLLWITTAEYLTSYINRTHEVNQGDSLDHDFSVILELLCFPITELFKIDLPLAVMKDISTCWSNLFSSFVRESSLLSTVEDNQTVEEFCSKMIRLVENGDIILTDYSFLGKLLRILSMVTENLSYTERSTDNQVNRAKLKPENPLKNAKSLVRLFQKVFEGLTTVDSKKDKVADVHLGEFLEIIEKYFSKIAGPDLIMESVDKIGSIIATFLSEDKPKRGSTSPSRRLLTNSSKHMYMVGKVLNEVYTCIFERFGKPLDNELLLSLVPLLTAAFSSERSVIRSRAIEFWNKSFGQMKHLVYPEELWSAMQLIKTGTTLIVPGMTVEKDDAMVVLESEESQPSSIAQSPNIRKSMSPSLRSPHKIHGSFLQKALSAEKASRSPSPGKITIPRSPKSESRIKPVRRKLPLPLDHEDSNEFVRIAPSPKKRRVLTEHQKEVLRSKSDLPVLYNQLDQHTQEPIFTEETQCTMDTAERHISAPDLGSVPIENDGKIIGMTDNSSRNNAVEQKIDDGINDFASGERQTTPRKLTEKSNEKKAIVSEVSLSGNRNNRSENIEQMKYEEGDRGLGNQIKTERGRGRHATEEQNVGTNGESNEDAKQESKPNTRRSLKTSFKDILKFITDQTAEEGADASDSENATVDSNGLLEEDVIPSSYTPLRSSEVDHQASPFKFSPSSLFSKAAKSFETSSLAEPELPSLISNCAIDDENVKAAIEPTEEIKVDENVASSTSLDFIPSSQSQQDAAPILKGVTRITPRRSNRKIKKTERFLEAEAKNLKRSQLKLPVVVLSKEGSISEGVCDTTIVDIGKYRKDKPESLERFENMRTREKIDVNSDKQKESHPTIEESNERVIKDKGDVKNSDNSLQDRQPVITESSSNCIISISDDELDSALCEIDLDAADAGNGDEVVKKLESKEQIGENGPRKRRTRKKKEDGSVDGINDNLVTAESGKEDNAYHRSGSRRLRSRESGVNFGKENAVTKESERQRADRASRKIVANGDGEKDHRERQNYCAVEKGGGKVRTSQKIRSSLNERPDDVPQLEGRSARIVRIDEQTQTLAYRTNDKVNQEKLPFLNAQGIIDGNSLPVSGSVEVTLNAGQGTENCVVDLGGNPNNRWKSALDDKESPALKVASFSSTKRRRKQFSRKRRSKRILKSTSMEATSLLEDDVKEREFGEDDEHSNTERALSVESGKADEKMKESSDVVPSKHDAVLEEKVQRNQRDVYDSSKLKEVGDDTQEKVKEVLSDNKAKQPQIIEDSLHVVAAKVSEGVIELRKKIAARGEKFTKQLSSAGKSPANKPVHSKDTLSILDGKITEKNLRSNGKNRRRATGQVRRTRAQLLRKKMNASQCKPTDVLSVRNDSDTQRNVRPKNSLSQRGGKTTADLDSSVEDSLTLSDIRKYNNEASGEVIDINNCGHDSTLVSCSVVDDQGKAVEDCSRGDQLEQSHGETRAQSANIEGETDNTRNRKRAQFQDNIESETIENIFNSPDSSDGFKKPSLSGRDSFLIVGRTVVEESYDSPVTADETNHPQVEADSKNENIANRDELETGIMIEKDEFHRDDIQTGVLPHSSSSRDSITDRVGSEISLEKCEPQNLCASVRSAGVAFSPLEMKKTTGECSPLSGILKRRAGEKPETPSPPNKNRRVSFAFPLEEKRSISSIQELEKCSELAMPLPANEENDSVGVSTRGVPRRFTAIQKKSNPSKVGATSKGPPICPELIECTIPIENLLPSITSGSSSLGLSNFIRSQNIRTIGNLCVLSTSQIEALPIRAPKVRVVKAALRKYVNMQKKGDKSKSMQNVLANDSPSSGMKTPIKEVAKVIPADAAIKQTPTQRSHVKPTALFSDFEELATDKRFVSRAAVANGIDALKKKLTENQRDFLLSETEIADRVVNTNVLPEEVKLERSSMQLAHDANGITDDGCVESSKQTESVQNRNELSTAAEFLELCSIEGRADSGLQNGLSQIDDRDRNDDSGTLLDHNGTGQSEATHQEIKEGSREGQLAETQGMESLEIIEETELETEKAAAVLPCFEDALEEKARRVSPSKNALGSEVDGLLLQDVNSKTAGLPRKLGELFGNLLADNIGRSEICSESNKSCPEELGDSGLDDQPSIRNPEEASLTDIDMPQKDSGNEYQMENVRDELPERDMTIAERKSRLDETENDSTEIDENVIDVEVSYDYENPLLGDEVPANNGRDYVFEEENTCSSGRKEMQKFNNELKGNDDELSATVCKNPKVDKLYNGATLDNEKDILQGLPASAEPDCMSVCEALDKIIDDIRKNLPEISLKESMAIYRKVTDTQKLIFNEIERKIGEESS